MTRPMDSFEIAERIKSYALDLEFTAVGITSAEPLSKEGKMLAEWLQRGYHGSMDWMARTRDIRPDPRGYFPEARSVVCLAANYFRDEPLDYTDDEACISLYARGRDYHKVLRKRLRKLLEFVQQLDPGAKGRICVDSFPLLEKPLAVRSGIGWIGKHTNLILKQQGSWFFLAELLLSIDLPADDPFNEDHCGTCNRCQVACPTDALNEAYVLDAQRCISYLNIEHDGPIADELARDMGNLVFGCDICQAVCPWNRFQTETEEPDFKERLDDGQRQLEALASLDQASFETLFAGTPVRRAGYENFMRNVKIAMENRDM